MTFLNGIDVSSWQATINLARVPCDFVIVKVSQGTGITNTARDRQITGALQNGKKLGLYHYGMGLNPEKEAAHFWAYAQKYKGRAALFLDWEEAQNASFAQMRKWTDRFCRYVEARSGQPCGLYFGAKDRGYFQYDSRPKWIAEYANIARIGYQARPWKEGAYPCAIRQYSGTGLLAGYAGNLDLNKYYGSRDSWNTTFLGKVEDMPTAQEIADAVMNYNLNGVKFRDRVIGTDMAANAGTAAQVWQYKTSGRNTQAQDRLTGIDGAANAAANATQTIATAMTSMQQTNDKILTTVSSQNTNETDSEVKNLLNAQSDVLKTISKVLVALTGQGAK